MPETSLENPLQSALLASLAQGQTGGVDLQSLLAAQAGGGQGGNLDIASLLAAQVGGANGEPADERMNLVMQWLQQRAASERSEPADDTPTEAELELLRLEEMRQNREREEEQREKTRELKRVMTSVYAELEALRARNDTLAAALGACYLCFGEDIACAACGGQGGAGSLPPDPAAFRQYVAPAVKRVRAMQARKPGGASPYAGNEYQPQGNSPLPNSNQSIPTH